LYKSGKDVDICSSLSGIVVVGSICMMMMIIDEATSIDACCRYLQEKKKHLYQNICKNDIDYKENDNMSDMSTLAFVLNE